MRRFFRCFQLCLISLLLAGLGGSYAGDNPPQPTFPEEEGILTRVRPRCYVYKALPVPVSAQNGGKGVKVLVTNDVHGNIFEQEGRGRLGYAKLRGYVESLKKEGWQTFLLDAGDAFSGTAVAQFDEGKSVAELMGRMGYRVLTPGNHAFDYNSSQNNVYYYPDVLVGTVRNNTAGPLDATCVNLSLYGKDVPNIRKEPVVVLEDENFRLVVAGVITPYAASATNMRGVRDYDFGLVATTAGPDHAATKANVMALLANAVARYDRPNDIVLVLSHVGWDTTEDYAYGQISGKDLALVPQVDVVVDSHSHNLLPVERIGSALYGLADRYLTHVAEITITLEGDSARIAMELKSYAELKSIPSAEKILEETRGIADRLGMGDRLFQLDAAHELSDRDVSRESTRLGRFVCRQMQALTRADLAIYNAGGIRSGLAPGWVTVGDVYDVLPFQNDLLSIAMTGREIEAFFSAFPAMGTNGFPQFTGLKAYMWRDGDRLALAGLLCEDGAPLALDTVYTVATISFLAAGGDGYRLPGERVRDDYGDFFTALVRRLRQSDGSAPEGLEGAPSLLIFDDSDSAFAALSDPAF